MLKHDLRTSLKVASWPIEVRYFWTLLWGYVDDHGKGVDSPLLVKADCFPLDPDITGDTVDAWLWLLADAGVVARYTVNGTDYIQVINWTEHQKPPHPTEDVLPNSTDPKATQRTAVAPFMHDAGNAHASLTPVLGWVESGFKSGSGFVSTPAVSERTPDVGAIFDDAYSHWPKKVKRDEAFERFKVAAKKQTLEVLADDIIRFGDAYAATTRTQYVPALGPWIFQKRWTDDLPTAPEPEHQSPTRNQQNMAVVALLAQKEQQGVEA
jgi:hypothetical protein